MHELLWPGSPLPNILTPSAVNQQMGPSDESDPKYFTENTLPTSFMMSAICAQIIQGRSARMFRQAASSLLYDLLKKLVQTSKMTVRLSSHGNEFNIPVPTSGTFPTAVFCTV